MPTYDFRCATCGAEREVSATMADADQLRLVCTDCGGTMDRRVSTTVSAIFRSAAPASSPPSISTRRTTCVDGVVKLRRPNPFKADLPAPPTKEVAR